MSYRNLVVQLELGRPNKAPLCVARDMAKRVHAHVTGISAAQPIGAIAPEGYYTPAVVREDAEWIEHHGEAAEREFHAEMKDIKETEWVMLTAADSLSARIASATGPADILVIGVAQDHRDSKTATRWVDADELIMRAGRPVLIVPSAVQHFGFHCALVAWKNCREARRAVIDALPLLRLMDKVVIAEIADQTGGEAAQARLDRMVAWLAAQSIAAVPRLEIAAGEDGPRLLALAEAEKAELIVAGAYGHSHFREWVLGGVTRHLLRHSQHCLLLSH